MSYGDAVVESVTVIVPVRNEAEFIAETVTALLRQDALPPSYEVLVVDGMSDDGTKGAPIKVKTEKDMCVLALALLLYCVAVGHKCLLSSLMRSAHIS